MRITFVTAAAVLLGSSPAAAVNHVVSLQGQVGATASGAALAVGEGSADERYEFENDFLQSHYGVPLVSNPNNPGARASALPPLERVVVETRSPSTGRTNGFHIPTSGTGIPEADGGTGVFQALTNVGSKTRDSGVGCCGDVSRAWVTGVDVAFSLNRTGNTITYRLANGSNIDDVWSFTADSVAEINAMQFRIRSAGQNSVALSDLFLTTNGPAVALGCNTAINATTPDCGVGLTGAISASGGDTHISLFDGILGDFHLTGKWTYNLNGGRATNNAQIKLLSVPVLVEPVPEPAAWTMLILGFGLVGGRMRSRRLVAAVS